MAETDQDQTQNGAQEGGSGATPPQPGQGGDQQAGGAGDAQTQTQTPATQAKGAQVKLSQEQIDRLLKDGTLDLPDEVYSGAVQQRISAYAARAKAAEERLKAIEDERAESERKQLEEQQRFKELYEKERQGREAEHAARTEEALRSRFVIAATQARIVDPEGAYLLARSLDSWGGVKLDEHGKVLGIDEVVQALIESKPYLVSQQQSKPQSVGSASNPGRTEATAPTTFAEAGDAMVRDLRSGA